MPFSQLQSELDERAAQGLLRQRCMIAGPQSPHVEVDGKLLLSFSSNDYLGLANHPSLIEALRAGALQHGLGAGAAHLVSGHSEAHHRLEQRLATFVEKPAALLFSTGYMANLGAVQALVGRGDTVYADKLNHASLNDAMLLCRADVKRYRHGDIAQLTQLLEQASSPLLNPLDKTTSHSTRLQKTAAKSLVIPQAGEEAIALSPSGGKLDRGCGRKLVITDAVFSMDGDIAPLRELLALCEKHDAWLYVDDAHGFGVLGNEGRGSLSHFGLASPRIIYMATLGKAAGVFGAFVAAEHAVIDTLINHANSYVYTTATPPALSVALLESVDLIEQGDGLRAHLRRLIEQLREGLADLPWRLMPSDTAIQPLLVGDNQQALKLSDGLRERGIWVAAIRPPTVPQGTARLRITLSAAHSVADVERLIGALHELAQGS